MALAGKVAVLVVACTFAGACGSDGESDSSTSEDDATVSDGGADDGGSVACPADLPELRVGEKGTLVVGKRGLVQARLEAASSVPPVRYENTWTVALETADGATLDDAEIVDACAFMPLHGHGAAPKAVRMLDDGRFELDALNLRMAGPWEIQLAVRAANLQSGSESFTSCDRRALHPGLDYVVFHACVRDD